MSTKARLIFTAVMLAALMIFTNCTASSSIAQMCVETNTAKSWQMSVEKLNGTKVIDLRSKIKVGDYTANVKVSTEKGAITVMFTDRKGEEIAYTSEKITGNASFSSAIPNDAYKMKLVAEDFGGTVEVEIS